MKRLWNMVLLSGLLAVTGCSVHEQSAENDASIYAVQTVGMENSDMLEQRMKEEIDTEEAASEDVEEATETEEGSETDVDKSTQTEATSQQDTTSSGQTTNATNTTSATEAQVQPSNGDSGQSAAVSYNPDNVVRLAIAKCQAGGMITTEDNLMNALNEGRITQEEYNEYYPLDGLGYYSVFVNVDLNKASTTSGRLLGSEEGIAQYIADMLLLETDPVFNIRCVGTYSTSSETFYEFRCYR